MKRILIILSLTIINLSSILATDHIILRNGQEHDVKLYQITNDNVIYSPNGNKAVARETIPTKDVYMVNIEKQGNVYLTKDGKRITGETSRVDRKKYDVIYLVGGGEIGATSITITEDEVKYSPAKKGGLLANILGVPVIEGLQSLPNKDVFMIRYKSGMIDVITPIDKYEEPEEEVEEIDSQTPQFTVLFHAVAKGESLKSVAEQYNVDVSQIIEWNDLPQKSKPSVPLKVGMQLMIYQPKIK